MSDRRGSDAIRFAELLESLRVCELEEAKQIESGTKPPLLLVGNPATDGWTDGWMDRLV